MTLFVFFPKTSSKRGTIRCCHSLVSSYVSITFFHYINHPLHSSTITTTTSNISNITMANIPLTTITFSILFLISISGSVATGRLGGRTKVTDVKTNKEIQAIGRYSVEEYNRRLQRNDGGELTFYQVVEAEKQVVAGMKYYLKIETFSKTGGDPKMFQAVVEVKPWLHSKKLLKFAPSSEISLHGW